MDLVAGALMITSAAIWMFSGHGGAFQSFLIWSWGIFFGITLICLSLFTPPWIPTWFPFMQTFLGKGLFISLGASLTSGWCNNFCFQSFVFIYCILVSITYIVCHCACGMNASPGPLCAGGMLRGIPRGAPPPAQRGGKETKGALPAGWRSAVDPASGQVYYSHTSGVTQWTRP